MNVILVALSQRENDRYAGNKGRESHDDGDAGNEGRESRDDGDAGNEGRESRDYGDAGNEGREARDDGDRRVGVIYKRWGRNECPETARLVYAGTLLHYLRQEQAMNFKEFGCDAQYTQSSR